LLKIKILNKYWCQYKPFLLFLGKFALTYLVLTFAYQYYLNQFEVKNHEVDGFTRLVTGQVEQTLLFFNCDAHSELHPTVACYKFFYNGKYISRIVEGCNALSVIILFIAFVIAFSGKLKHTILYIIGGSLIIHILNITRIALLMIAFYNFPEANTLLHDILFPLVIYGTVFILWVIWVNKFSFYAKKAA
jgi:exosortase family protein XrtF